MRYFELLNLRREPFSNSPDPELFHAAKQHQDCLRRLEIAVRLRRGLNVVTGHVGTGKTTLCRQLIGLFRERQGISTHLIMDPYFSDPEEFLRHLAGLFGLSGEEIAQASQWGLREKIKEALLAQAGEADRLVVLIVDEGQKISPECLEILRELLNYETNEQKLLQIVIFGQDELEPLITGQANLADRVNMHFRLGPLDFRDTRDMIRSRLTKCAKDLYPEGLFTFGAFAAIYLATKGYPRQIVQLCHHSLLGAIMKERPKVTWGLVRGCRQWQSLGRPKTKPGRWPWALGAAAALLLAAWWLTPLGSMVIRPKPAFMDKPAGQEQNQPAPQAPGQAPGQAPVAVPPEPAPLAQIPAAQVPAEPAQDTDRPALGAKAGQDIVGLEVREEGQRSVVNIRFDNAPGKVMSTFKANPARLLVEVLGAYRRAPRDVNPDSPRIALVRTTILTDRLRMTIYLKDAKSPPIKPSVEKIAKGLRIVVR
jgi:general secretion pathway protein A